MRSPHVEQWPIAKLDERRWPDNPKDHDLGELTRSIRRFGFTTPILLDERSGRIVAGHGRLEAVAAIRAEGESAPLGITIAEDGDWEVPVLRGVAFRSDAEARAYVIADNQHTMLGGWHNDKLVDWLKDLSENDTLDGTGFDGDDLEALWKDVHGEDTEEEDAGDQTDDLTEQYQVLVICKNEFEQTALLEKLAQENYECRALIS